MSTPAQPTNSPGTDAAPSPAAPFMLPISIGPQPKSVREKLRERIRREWYPGGAGSYDEGPLRW